MNYRFLIFILFAVVGIVAAKMTPMPPPHNMLGFLIVEFSIFGLGVWVGRYSGKQVEKEVRQ